MMFNPKYYAGADECCNARVQIRVKRRACLQFKAEHGLRSERDLNPWTDSRSAKLLQATAAMIARGWRGCQRPRESKIEHLQLPVNEDSKKIKHHGLY